MSFQYFALLLLEQLVFTVMEGIEELRFKETDRIHAMSEGLRSLGIETKEKQDGMIIEGKGPDHSINGNVTIESRLDHRIAMSFLCLGLVTENSIKVTETDTINSSFPSFFEIMNKIGANLKHK